MIRSVIGLFSVFTSVELMETYGNFGISMLISGLGILIFVWPILDGYYKYAPEHHWSYKKKWMNNVGSSTPRLYRIDPLYIYPNLGESRKVGLMDKLQGSFKKRGIKELIGSDVIRNRRWVYLMGLLSLWSINPM